MAQDQDEAADLVAADQPEVTKDVVDRIKALYASARSTEAAIAKLTLMLADAKRQLDHITTRDLPELMDGAGIPSMTIADGDRSFTVTVKTFYSASISAKWDEDRRNDAFKWLDDHGHGSLIKTEVVTNFPRDERDEVGEFVKQLDESGRSYLVRQGVHSGTLSAWLKEMVTSGNTPPLDVVGGYVERQATIKEDRS